MDYFEENERSFDNCYVEILGLLTVKMIENYFCPNYYPPQTFIAFTGKNLNSMSLFALRSTFHVYSTKIATKQNQRLFCSLSQKFSKENSDEEKQQLLELSKYSYSNNNLILLHMSQWKYYPGHVSMFTGKLKAYFEYNQIPYEFHPTMVRLLPMNKMPWITYKDKHIADSDLIISYFNNEFCIDNDAHLTNEQKAISYAFKTATDKQLYWTEIYRRWSPPNNGIGILDSMMLPEVMTAEMVEEYRLTVFNWIHEQLWQQGTGRFNGEQVYKMLYDHIESIVMYLGDKQFFCGDKISCVDFTLYGHLSSMYTLQDNIQIAFPGIDDEKRKYMLPFSNEIHGYVDRIEKEVMTHKLAK
eukprot:111467_1